MKTTLFTIIAVALVSANVYVNKGKEAGVPPDFIASDCSVITDCDELNEYVTSSVATAPCYNRSPRVHTVRTYNKTSRYSAYKSRWTPKWKRNSYASGSSHSNSWKWRQPWRNNQSSGSTGGNTGGSVSGG